VRVSLATDALADAGALTDILLLLRTFAIGRHDLVAEPEEIDALRKYLATHAPGQPDPSSDLARKGTVAAMWTASQTQGTVVRITGQTLADSTADLCQPAVVVVENFESDGAFIRSIAKVLRSSRVSEALHEGWFLIESGGGGGEVPKVAVAKARHFRTVIRVAVLLDSDRWLPGERTKAHDKADFLASIGIVAHVLEFREAENYVPNRALAATRSPRHASQRLNHLKRLTPAQRAHFDMKRGFGPSGQVRAEQVTLYSALYPNVIHGLREGFGSDLLRQLEDRSDTLTESDFASLGDGAVEELRSLLAKLASVI
jgi:hypothetical protein